ncbi:uncharacterized protein O3C94_020493 [Discoglossus pictus]
MKPKMTTLIMKDDFLGCVFTALQQDRIFDLFIKEEDLDEVGAMSPYDLSEKLPEQLPPEMQDYSIGIFVDEAAMVTLDPSKSLLHLYSTMEVGASYRRFRS